MCELSTMCDSVRRESGHKRWVKQRRADKATERQGKVTASPAPAVPLESDRRWRCHMASRLDEPLYHGTESRECEGGPRAGRGTAEVHNPSSSPTSQGA